jgi:hypothetical protein
MKTFSKRGFSLTSLMIAAVVGTLASLLIGSLMKGVFSQGNVAEIKGIITTETEIARNMASSPQMLAAIVSNNLLVSNATSRAQLSSCLQNKGTACNTGSWTASQPLSLPTTPTLQAFVNKQGNFRNPDAACAPNCDYSLVTTARYICPDATSCSALELRTTVTPLKAQYKSSIKTTVNEFSIPARRLINTETLSLQCQRGQVASGFDSIKKETICSMPPNPCAGSSKLCMKVRNPSVNDQDANGNGDNDDGAPAAGFAIDSVSLNQFTAVPEPPAPSAFYSVYSDTRNFDRCSMSCNDGKNIYRTDKTCTFFKKGATTDTQVGITTKSSSSGAIASIACAMAPNPEYNLSAEKCGSGSCYQWSETGCSVSCGGGLKTYRCVGRAGQTQTSINPGKGGLHTASIAGQVFPDSNCTSPKPRVACNTQPCCLAKGTRLSGNFDAEGGPGRDDCTSSEKVYGWGWYGCCSGRVRIKNPSSSQNSGTCKNWGYSGRDYDNWEGYCD